MQAARHAAAHRGFRSEGKAWIPAFKSKLSMGSCRHVGKPAQGWHTGSGVALCRNSSPQHGRRSHRHLHRSWNGGGVAHSTGWKRVLAGVAMHGNLSMCQAAEPCSTYATPPVVIVWMMALVPAAHHGTAVLFCERTRCVHAVHACPAGSNRGGQLQADGPAVGRPLRASGCRPLTWAVRRSNHPVGFQWGHNGLHGPPRDVSMLSRSCAQLHGSYAALLAAALAAGACQHCRQNGS